MPLAVVLGLYLGVHYGSFAAAGSDSYGYVSQARLWLSGIPRVEQPWVQDFAWQNREWVFSPLGYRPFSPDGTIVPTYPPGLPMIMAVFLGVLGDNGPFYVVPILGALTVWLTYVLGRDAAGSRTVGALAALLLLASPVFLTHLLVPMSDVPAAAGWTLVAVLVLKQRALAAGIASGLTLLVRPNLILMALVPVFAWQKRREPLIRYAVGVVPGLVAIMVINTLLYGGPLSTGYGSLFEAYSLSSLPLNVRNYVAWLVETQTPLILLALVSLFARRALREDSAGQSPRACLAAIVGLMFLSYLFYATFNHWFYLRFLLPAYPALFVLLAASIRWLALKLPLEARVPAAALVCAAMVPFGVNVGRREGIFNVSSYEQRHVRAAREVASRTPAEAVVLSVQHSGSVRYYANRITLRYDWLKEDALDASASRSRRQGPPRVSGRRRLGGEGVSRPLFAGQPRRAPRLGADRACSGQPRSAHFRDAGRRPCSCTMKKAALSFLVYCVVTVALTYPLILQMGSVLPNDAGDPALNTWILWWNTQTMPFSTAWWNAPAFFPAPGVLSFSENLLGLSLMSTPLHWLGVGPQAAYNVVFFLTFPLSALGAYLLGYELTKRHDAAFIAGLLFGFAPYRIAHLPQIQSLASFPMPFALLGLHRYLRDPRPKWLALFAGGWFLQGLCNGYYLLFFSVFVGLWILWFASPWSRPRQFLAIGAGMGDCRDSDVAAPAALPRHSRIVRLHARFRHDQGLRRRRGEPAARDRPHRAVGMARSVSTTRRRAVSWADGCAAGARGRRLRAGSPARRTSTAGRSRGGF